MNTFVASFPLQVHVNPENLGYVVNFEQAIAAILREQFSYIALGDQDDIWEPSRIADGMNALLKCEEKVGNNAYLLAHGDLRLVDSNKRILHDSFL